MGMKLPFPRWLAKTDVKVCSTKVNEDGEPGETPLYDGKCIYTDKSRTVLNAEKQLITLTGKVVIEGDIAPNDGTIQGIVKVRNTTKTIYGSERPLNPDGTVYSTELSLQ